MSRIGFHKCTSGCLSRRRRVILPAKSLSDRSCSCIFDSVLFSHITFFYQDFYEYLYRQPGPRWSGRDGPFLLKAGVRVRGHEGTLGAVTTAALPRWAAAAHAAPHREAHAQLYAIEGLIELGEAAAARTALTALIAAHGGQRGVRESLDGGPRRSDVLAQLLRAACLLGVARPDDPAWAALATELAGRVDAEGRLPFASAGDDCPTWAALFTEQALSLWLGATLPTSVLV